MLLDGKNAVIYGGAGAVGRAVARAFAREGAGVHLAGRTLTNLDEVADGIRAAGGTAELGPYGIRAVSLHTGGVPATIPEDFAGRDAIVSSIVDATMLKRAATFDDIGDVAAFAASDRARTMTATALNITCGAVAD